MSAYTTGYSTGFGPLPAPPPPPPPAVGSVRDRIAAALAAIPQVTAGDWTVLAAATDTVEPPAYVIVDGPDPGGTRQTFCTYQVQFEVLCVAHRLEPEANVLVVDDMIEAAVVALEAAGLAPYQWLVAAPLELAQITYLAARLQLRQPVTIGVP